MSDRRTYADILDAIGLHVDHARGADVLVNEIDGGFLLAFVDGAEQRVTTFDTAQLDVLLSEAARQRARGWTTRLGIGKLGQRAPYRVRLRDVGRYLDARSVTSILVQESADGFVIQYTGDPTGNLQSLTRLHDKIDDERLRRLAQ